MTTDFVDLPVLDRSTLEAYAVCPRQARYIETGKAMPAGQAAAVGNVVHDALAHITGEMIASGGAFAHDVYDWAAWAVRTGRPDVQGEALCAIRPSLYAWGRKMADNWRRVRAFQGGEGDFNSQYCLDFVDVTVTSELDLLLAGGSDRTLLEVDYKTGHRAWTEDDVRSSFQFQTHAALVFAAFPTCDALDVQVFLTRRNVLTKPVRFDRERDGDTITDRINKALDVWRSAKAAAPEDAEAWPTEDTCTICPAVLACGLGRIDFDIHNDLSGFMGSFVQTTARLAAMERIAKRYVAEHGDIISPHGCYGVNAPAVRQPIAKLYSLDIPHGKA